VSKNFIIAPKHVADGQNFSKTIIRPAGVITARLLPKAKSPKSPSYQSTTDTQNIACPVEIRPFDPVNKLLYEEALGKAEMMGAIGTLKLC
jgi:hypothetical protein